MARRSFCVALGEHVGLLDNLTRVAEQLGSVIGEGDAAVAASEYGDAKFSLELLDCRGEIGLRGVEVLRSSIDGAEFGNSDKVAKLLESHGEPFLTRTALSRAAILQLHYTQLSIVKITSTQKKVQSKRLPQASSSGFIIKHP